MDTSMVNSALWFVEHSSSFLKSTGALPLLDKGFDSYAMNYVSLSRHLIDIGRLPSDVTEGEINAQFTMAYVTYYWRKYKTVYNFSPSFLNMLVQTEDAPVYSDILMRMPYPDYIINLPKSFEYDYMFVHMEFDASHGPNDTDTLFLVVPFSSNPDINGIKSAQCMQWCLNGKRIIESFRDSRAAFVASTQNNRNDTAGNGVTGRFPEELAIKQNDAEKSTSFQASMEKYLRVAVSASYYLASKNAEIKRVKIQKGKRPLYLSSSGAKPKKVNLNTYDVGYVIGQSFERQMAANVKDCSVRSGKSDSGRVVRPHIRRAHWHHYWVGEGRTKLEVRWIEPTLILPGNKREPELATIRRVRGA